MKIIKLQAENFRNIENETIEFSPDTNLIYGNNAEGKTNIIEAIYYFANSKSFRTNQDHDLIKFGADSGKIVAVFEEMGRICNYEVNFSKNEKRSFYYNGIKISKMSDFFGNFRAVLFVPEHLKIIKNGPSERRALMDSSLCQIKKSYITLLFKHSKTVGEKNALLKDYKGTESQNILLDVYDDSLIKLGGKITEIRKEWAREIFERAKVHLEKMSGDKLSYEFKMSGLSEKKDALEFYSTLIPSMRQRDINYKCATAGAIKDDIEIFVNDIPLRHYGSQGQQRSAVIALKLAEGELIEEKTNSSPIYLFDDILSELDEKRQEYILSKLYGKQVMITSCIKDTEFLKGEKIYVEKGKYKKV
ncbi:MAG: DNA replication/repair protein RecF [Ruminococcaceae bacterium]|nr:DNA replication/repair protein RecF [Oscillospiraceae bacterium]